MIKPTIRRRTGRPTNRNKNIERYLVSVSEGLQKEQINKKLVSSKESLKHIIDLKGDKAKFLAVDYYPALISGRGPGKAPPIDKMRDYVKRENIVFEGMTLNQTAFLIGRRIARRGNRVYTGEVKGVDLGSVVARNLEELIEQIGDDEALELANRLIESIETF